MKNEILLKDMKFTCDTGAPERGSFESHCHTELEIILVLKGRVRFIVEEKVFLIREPCAVFLLPAVYHSVLPEDKTEYERICCLMKPESVPEAVCEKFRKSVRSSPVVVSGELTRVTERIRKILEGENSGLYGPYLQALVCELFYLAVDQSTENVQYQPDSTADRILRYINEHQDRMIGIADIAGALYLSPSSVSHLFRKHLNISVKQYILQKKMLLADSYMAAGMTALEASQRVGYANYSNFCAIYKKIRGQYPKKSSVRDRSSSAGIPRASSDNTF